MSQFTYETVARFGMVTSLLLFVALFAGIVVYVFFFANRKRLDEAQRTALDLKPEAKRSEKRP